MKTTLLTLILLSTGHVFSQKSTSSVLGNADYYALLNAVPVLQTSPEAAFQYVCNKSIHCEGDSKLKLQYDAFIKQMELYANQIESHYASKVHAYNSKNGGDGYKNQANQNEMIQRMGGMDRVMKMSDGEREVAAKKAMASNMSSSNLSPFTEADLQRMMNDPEYAKQMAVKYNIMTTQGKEDIINKKIVAGDLDDSHEAHINRLKDTKINNNTQDINTFVSKTTSRLYEANETCSTRIHQAKSSSGNHAELNESYDQLYKKIPLIVTDYWGKYPDPEKVKQLKKDYALKHKNRATIELSEVQKEHKKLKSIISEVISDYRSFLATNGHHLNGELSNLFDGTNTELSLLQVEKSIIGSIDRLAQISHDEDSTASGYEQAYQLILSGETL
ncbi:hypothetical protein [Arenibacter sp. S6351L]|uniref:hypothetical protein n=1 Tax=Arenibacter sp. S6351L TaxID=2926407 RepID=UPI001FF39741|nr:hypothetical protein [Arenibacter sp. S6351L]MCK0135589.1 hypothetical protein [Arenibacter sp. S6351L]